MKHCKTYRIYKVLVQSVAQFHDSGRDFVEMHLLLLAACNKK